MSSSLSLDQRRRPLRGVLLYASNLVPGDTNGLGDTFSGGSDSPTWDAGCLGSSLRAPRLFGSSHDGWGLEDSTPATPLILSEPLKKVRIDTVRRSESRAVESHTRDLSYTVGASALAEPVAHRITDDSVANDNHQAKVDDLFAQWETDPLQLLSLPDLGM